MTKYNCCRCLLVNLKTQADPVVFMTEGDNGIPIIDFKGNLCRRCVGWIYKNPDENIDKLNSSLKTHNTQMNQLLLSEIASRATEFWINWNYGTTHDEWLDNDDPEQHNAIWQNKIDNIRITNGFGYF